MYHKNKTINRVMLILSEHDNSANEVEAFGLTVNNLLSKSEQFRSLPEPTRIKVLESLSEIMKHFPEKEIK